MTFTRNVIAAQLNHKDLGAVKRSRLFRRKGLHEFVCLHRDADKPRPSSWDQDVMAAEVVRMNPNLSPQTKIGCRARPVHICRRPAFGRYMIAVLHGEFDSPPAVATSHRSSKLLKERHPDYHCRNLDRSKTAQSSGSRTAQSPRAEEILASLGCSQTSRTHHPRCR